MNLCSDLTFSPDDLREVEAFRCAIEFGKFPDCCDPRGCNKDRWWTTHRFYCELGWNSKKVTTLLPNDRMFYQNEVYIYAKKIKRVCPNIEDVARDPRKVDWALARAFWEEGMSDEEIAAYFNCSPGTIDSSPIHAGKLRRGMHAIKPKRWGFLRG